MRQILRYIIVLGVTAIFTYYLGSLINPSLENWEIVFGIIGAGFAGLGLLVLLGAIFIQDDVEPEPEEQKSK